MDEEGSVSQARVALGAVAPVPFRSKAAEEMLLGMSMDQISGEKLVQIGNRAAEDTRPITDVRTTAAYRKHVSSILVQRALAEVIGKLKV